jgi:hypothetical protein
MLEKFVEMLRKRINVERTKSILANGTQHGLTLERREALVARAKALEWVAKEMDEILKLREEDVDDDDATGADNDEPEDPVPPRRRPNARSWGG